MKHCSARTAVRWFFRLEIVCLCLTLAGIGAGIAAERTAYTARGVPAAVQTDTRVRSVVSRLPDKQRLASLAEYAPLLPAPVGNLAAVLLSFQKIEKNDLSSVFSILHNLYDSFSSFCRNSNKII